MVLACSVSAELTASASRVGVALLFDSAGRAYQDGTEHTETMTTIAALSAIQTPPDLGLDP